ncbi:MAG: gliding motility-associated C-terminal domain-containing protein [Bacteroidia bacterium]
MKRILLACFTLLLMITNARASHLMGGEITWKCLPTGQFRFFMKVYRDCNGIPFGPPVSLDVHNHPSLSSISMNLVSQTDISPTCNPGSGNPITCAGATGSTAGAVEEFIFQSNPITISGTPPAAGWIFSWGSCCRNAAITNLTGAGSDGFTLRAKMFAYNGLNTNPCYDSSPIFVETPNTIICSGYPFRYNHNAVDPELDSLVYSWEKPLDQWTAGAWTATNPAPLTFTGGYSYTNPLPGPAFNPLNVAAVLDASTGDITYTSYTNGVFVTVNKVSSYKCGQLVSEVFREIQVALLPCPSLNPPSTAPNHPPQVTIYDHIKGIYYPANSTIVDTVYAGQNVWIEFTGIDTDVDSSLAIIQPWTGGYQSMILNASGGEFGTGFSSTTTGCPITPCATLNPTPPTPPSPFYTVSNLYWQTTCDHLGYSTGCLNFENVYTFIIKVYDDYCPAPGISVNTVKIVLLAPPQVNPPIIRCTQVQPNGDVTLNWNTPVDTFSTFDAYLIYHSSNLAGPYTLIDSVLSLSQSNYTHVGAGANAGPQYYYIITRDLCKGNRYSDPSDTVASIFLTATNIGGGQAQLNWNPVTNPLLSSSSGMYHIFLEYPIGTWTLIDSTNANTYIDLVNILTCSDSLNYRVEISDSSGCTSVSSIDGALFQNYTQPDPPSLRCLVADNSGSVTLSWVAPVDTGLSFDGYYIYSATNAGGPFTILDSIFNYNTTAYPHNNAGIMSSPRYYYLQTYCKCGNAFSINSDTLQAIRLTVLNVGGVAQLNWNALHTPLLPTSSPRYLIYQEYPAGTWTLVDSTTNTFINIPKVVCSDSINFRIEIADASGCISKSTIDGKYFVDNTIPDPPELRCISVNANGSINLSWTLPVDTGMDYNSYHLYYAANAGGPFTEIDSSFNYSQNLYTHATANAYAGPVFYTIKTRTGCGVQYSAGSDTIQAILLNVTNPSGGNIANLSWNPIHNPLLPSASGSYKIYKEYPAGNWTWIGVTSSLNYIDTNPVCIDSINYRVEMDDASVCTSVSTIDGATFIDNSIPDAPELRCISVNADGSVNLSWSLPVDTGMDYNSYHLYYATNAAGPFAEIDSTFNYNQSNYTHTTANAYTGDVFYTIQTRTGCGVQYSTYSDTIQAIRLNVTNPTGGNIANLSWNPIRNPLLPTASGSYKIYKEYPAGNWNWIGVTSSLNYVDTNPVCIDSINYRVEMDDALICTSVSTIDGATFIDNSVPDAPQLRCINVNANGTITLSWELPVDTGLDYNSYHIYKSNSAAGPFTIVDSLFNYNLGSYTDGGANAYSGPLFYTIRTRTGCGVQYSFDSDTLQAMVLDVTNPGGLNTATLNWNAIHNPNLPTSSGWYHIYKEYPASSWSIVDSTQATTWQEPIVICYDSVHYQVGIADALGCESRSTIDADLFIDNTVPDAPDLRCVAIDPTGQVTLTWIAPVDTGLSFSSYHIFYSTSVGGPYNEVDSLFNYFTTSYLHTGANANNTNVYYYVESRTNCGVQYSAPSDTLHAIKLNVTAIAGNSVANLQWNEVHTPLLPTSDLYYKIYKEHPTGTWTYLDSTAALTYLDTINLCSDTIRYRVEIGDALGCISVSSIDGDIFNDNTPPALTLLDTVSVNPGTGQVTVSWLQNTSGDAVGYIIYLFNGASWDSIANVTGISSLSYLYAASNANNVIENYNIAAYDSCDNIAPLGTPHNTIHLTDTLDKCNAAINLKWNSYINMQGGLASYNIFMSENSAPYSLLANVGAGMLTYSHQGVKKDTSYCYYVQAVGDFPNRRASSNEACVVADVIIMPEFTYLKRVTVVSRDEVLIECYVDTAADLSRFKLVRSDNNGISYSYLQDIVFTGNPNIAFTDYTASTDSTSYYYKVIDVSTCDKDVQESNIGRTILLKATPFENLINKLEWNAYEEWSGQVALYNIYRYYGGVWTAAPIATVGAGTGSYYDNIAAFIDGTGEFCYLVEAVEGPGNFYGFEEKSESNEACAVQEPHLYLPSGFTPDGLNATFHPYMIYILKESFQMQVFNRWGQTIFESNDPDKGWDGTFDGQPSPLGVYVYHVKVKGANGKILEKRGTVTLIR